MFARSKNAFQMTVLAAAVALLAGCGGSDDNTTTTTAQADLAVSYSNTASLTANGSSTYKLRITNNSGQAVTGAMIKVPASTGITKTTVSCSTTSSVCTAALTPTVAQLEAGYALPTLAVGAFFELTITNNINAVASATINSTATVSLPSGIADSNTANNAVTSTAVVAAALPVPIEIEFAAVAGSQNIKCGDKITNLGTTSATAELRDLRFYVSGIHVMDANDNEIPVTLSSSDWQRDGTVLIDLEDGSGLCNTQGTPTTNAKIIGTVPAGTYTGVGYTVGLPIAQNHSDWNAAAAPLNVQAMAWSWQSGRKMLKIEVNPDQGVNRPAQGETPARTSSTFNIHLGATGCTGSNPAAGLVDQCERPNRMAYHSHDFNAATQRIAVDIQSLFASSNITEDLNGPFGCMSGATDPECAAIFDKLKIDLTTGQPIDGGHGQGLFKVVAK